VNTGDETLKARITGLANRSLDKAENAFDRDDAEDAEHWLQVAAASLVWTDPPKPEPEAPQQINVTLTFKEESSAATD
jgi:hypothetical protein